MPTDLQNAPAELRVAREPSLASIVLAPLRPHHRTRVREIVESTGNFSADEVAVALELFDEGVVASEARRVDAELGDRRPATRNPPPAFGGHPPATRDARPSTLSPQDYYFVGAYAADGKLIGFACYGPTPATDRTWDLYWIAVDRAAQGLGGGTVLLREVERRLEEMYARLLVVETSSRSDYAGSREFYLRRGYVEAARVREFYAPGDDRIIFTKRLESARGAGAERNRHE